MKKIRTTAIIGVLLCSTCQYCFGAQYIMYNNTYTWTGGTNNTCKDPKPGPTNWLTPDNYKDGKIYTRYEVTGKPNNRQLGIMIGYWEHSKGWCSPTCYSEQWAVYPNGPTHDNIGFSPSNFFTDITTNGVYYSVSDGFRYIWGPASTWTDPVTQVCFNFWDVTSGSYLNTNVCGPNCFKGGDVNQYCPFTIKMQAVHVSKGSTLSVPTEFNNTWTNCPSGWPCGTTELSSPLNNKPQQNFFNLCRSSGGYILKITSNGRHAFEVLTPNGISVIQNKGVGVCQYPINRTTLKPGIYLVRISNEKTNSLQKVVLW